MRSPPGPQGLPLLGSTLDAFARPYGFFLVAFKQHGDVVLFHFGPFRYFLLSDPDAIKRVLVDNARNYKKSRTYEFFVPVLGRGLLTSEGQHWLRHRRLSQSAFHHARLAAIADTMAA